MALGELLVQSGELAEARERLEDCLEWARAPGERWRVATAIFLLGIVALFEGDLDRARGHVAESMDAFSKVGNKYALASQIDIMAGVAVAEADPERALLLSAAADQIRASIRAQLAPHWADVRRRVVLAPAREALGDRAEAALASGRQLTVEEAMALAMGRPGTNGSVRERGHHDRPPTRLILSRREREVAGLVAEGMTNRQIAERLVLAERTVEGHVERIRGKLKVHSRTQIAVWVVEQARA